MANTSALGLFLSHLLLELQPTIIVILHITYDTPEPPEIEVLTDSLLTAIHRFQPIEPAIIIFSANEDQYYKIEERRLMAATAARPPNSLLLVYIGDDTYTILGTARALSFKREWRVQQSRQLFLIPARMWRLNDVAYELHDINPTAYAVSYQVLDGAVQSIVEVCRGLNCRKSQSFQLVDGYSPRSDIRNMSLCRLTFWHNQLRTTSGDVKPYECDFRLLAVLELHWNLCFDVEVLRKARRAYDYITVEHKCNGMSADPQQYPHCCWALLSMKIVGNHTPHHQLFQQHLPWTWHKYSMLVPNWWHWRTARSAERMATRTAKAIVAIATSALCWLLLLALRMLAAQRCPQGVGWHLVLEMWARTLGIAVSEGERWRYSGLALATTLLGMWNAIALTGALFELRCSGAEWQPVFQTLADVRQYDSYLQFHSPRTEFLVPMALWLRDIGVRNKNGTVTIVVLADGSNEEKDYMFKVHADNRSRIYRRVSDPSMVFPVWAVLNPIVLQSQMRDFVQRISEADLPGHLFRLKTHRQALLDLMLWPPNDGKPDGDEIDNSLWSFLQLFVMLLFGAIVLFGCEILI